MKRITQLEAMLAELEARMPAHSIPPNLIAEMDLLDEKIQAEKFRLEAIQTEGDNS
ncbi:MAG: hypothetical protein WA997_05955 [Anaerolineales bacterium]|nr:hypothetical protein [Anaerolineales bacterium]